MNTKETVKVELTVEQREFLVDAMRWWNKSGVNYWSAKTAEEILFALLRA